MKALRFDGQLKVVEDEPVPRKPGEALVRVICAGICNTDLEITKGYAGFRGTLGHEFVGRVVESPDEGLIGRRVVGEINAGCGRCDLCRSGDRRHCPTRTVLGIKGRDGAFAEYLSLPAANLWPVPDSIPDEAAVFVEPLAAAFNILEQVQIHSSTAVAVIGDGKLAQLIVRAIATTGCDVTVVGKHDDKLALLAQVAASCLRVEELEDGTQRRGAFDVVVEASGSPSGLSIAMGLVRPTGTIVLKSTHHLPTPVDLSQVVVNEVKLVGSRCGRFGPAIEALESGRVKVSPLVTARLPLEEGAAAFEAAALPEMIKVLLCVG